MMVPREPRMSLPYIEPPRATHAAPRRVRLPWRSSARPVFSWRHVRAPWDSRWLQWQMFLLFWLLAWCYFAFYSATASWGSTAGIRLLLYPEATSEIQFHKTTDYTELTACEEKERDPSKYPGLVCVDICPGWEVFVSGKRVDTDQLSLALAQAGASSEAIEVVVNPHPDIAYGDFVDVVDQIASYQERTGSPHVDLLIAPTWPRSLRLCRRSGMITVTRYEPIDDTHWRVIDMLMDPITHKVLEERAAGTVTLPSRAP